MVIFKVRLNLYMERPFRRFLRERFFPQDITEEYVERWRRKGFPEEVIAKALVWARNYAESIVGVITENVYEKEALIARAMPRALAKAEKWIEGVMA